MSQHSPLYRLNRWTKLRKQKLLTDPLCWYCLQMGNVTVADTVDHIVPHKGDVGLFFDWDNLRSSCGPCHNSTAALKDRLGFAPGCGLDGFPVDGGHFWGNLEQKESSNG